jgi:hypothetical protein
MMPRLNSVLYFCVLNAALLFSFSVLAQADDADKNPTKAESPVVLPSPVTKNNLLPFYVSPTTSMDFAIDAKSVTVTDDGVVRFSLIITSPSGAKNISYEGIRCSSGEKKLYAIGQLNGSWSPARRDTWEPIFDHGSNRYHAALAKDYFCESGVVAGKAEAITERLRKKKTLR